MFTATQRTMLLALPGNRQGMTGGRVFIDGSVGALAGGRMRSGLSLLEEMQGSNRL